MAWTDATLNLAANAIAGAGTWISAHTGDPGTTGANEVTGGSYARQQTTWGTASAGDRAGTQVSISIPGGTTVTYWGVWSASTAGTFCGGFQLSASETFGAAGSLNHTPTIDVDPPA